MSLKDLHSNVDAEFAFTPQAISTDTTTAGEIIDMQAYGAIEFLLFSGTLTDGTYTPKLEVGDDSGLSDAEEVDTANLMGTIADATFAASDDDAIKMIGIKHGNKRYCRISIVSTGTSTGGTMSAIVLKGYNHIEREITE